MKVTKFPQSCLLLEKDGQKIVIDPGLHFLQTHKIDELGDVVGVLYTHEHSDHYNPEIADTLKQKGIKLYANQSTAKLIGEGCAVISDGQEFTVGNFEVKAYELPHCLVMDGQPGPQNTGYAIDDTLFHPGDGKELDGLTADNLALPIVGPDISLLDAANFARQLGAKVAIPIHFDGIPASPDVFKEYAQKGKLDCEIRVLSDGESTEL